MRSFFRFNGVETSVENALAIDGVFNETLLNEIRKVFGEKVYASVEPVENFKNPDQSEAIFHGVVTGKYEGETPVKISIFADKKVEDFDENLEIEPDFTVPAFLGFRK